MFCLDYLQFSWYSDSRCHHNSRLNGGDLSVALVCKGLINRGNKPVKMWIDGFRAGELCHWVCLDDIQSKEKRRWSTYFYVRNWNICRNSLSFCPSSWIRKCHILCMHCCSLHALLIQYLTGPQSACVDSKSFSNSRVSIFAKCFRPRFRWLSTLQIRQCFSFQQKLLRKQLNTCLCLMMTWGKSGRV